LRDLLAGNGQVPLAVQVNAAGVLEMQFIQLGADFAPDARFLGSVLNDRRPKALESATAAEGK
jgi:hypothetical protein